MRMIAATSRAVVAFLRTKSCFHCLILTTLLLFNHQYGIQAWLPIPMKTTDCAMLQRRVATQQPRQLQLHQLQHQQEPHSNRNRETVLSMGLRSFIGRIKRNRREEEAGSDNDEDEGDIDSNWGDGSANSGDGTTTAAAFMVNGSNEKGQAWRPSMQYPDSRPTPVRMGEDPSSKEINVFNLDRAESVQERINRVKSGKMTDEEKQAYLRAALSSGTTPESRLPLRPPISKAEQESMERHTKASPFPGDPIYRNIAGGGKRDNLILSNNLVDRAGLDVQKKKRDYLDMVTDPHRFDVYRTAGSRLGRGPAENAADSGTVNGDGSTANDNESSKPILDPLPTDLGERLAAAANAQEVSRRQAEEDKRKREKEWAKRDPLNRNIGEKRTGFPPVFKENLVEQKYDQERLKELMKAQDDFWSRKLASEREARERQARLDNPKYTTFMGGGKSSRNAPHRSSSTESTGEISNDDASEETEESSETLNGDTKQSNVGGASVFNPDESNLLNDVPDKLPRFGNPRNRSWFQSSLSPSDLNDVRTLDRPPAFGYSRQPKRDNPDDDQIRRLRELSSPLPNRTPQPVFPNGVRGAQSAPPPFQPQRPISAASSTSSSFSSSSPLGGNPLSLDNLMKNNFKNSPSTASKTKDLHNGFSGKTTDSSDKSTVLNTSGRSVDSTTRATPVQTVSTTADQSEAARNPISMMFGSSSSKQNPIVSKQTQSSSTNPSSTTTTTTTTTTPRRKGPIRMQLPLVDDDPRNDDDDDDDAVDTRSNSGMNIAEAMKRASSSSTTIGTKGTDQDERSKKWGVDMSRFM